MRGPKACKLTMFVSLLICFLPVHKSASSESEDSSSHRPSTSTKRRVHQQRVTKPRGSSPVAKSKLRSQQSKRLPTGSRRNDNNREFDVLQRHHERNGPPRPPSQQQLRASASRRRRVQRSGGDSESTTSEDESAEVAADTRRSKRK